MELFLQEVEWGEGTVDKSKGLFWGPGHHGGREQEGFLSCRLPLLSMGYGEGPRDMTLLELDQKILDELIKIMFLGEAETAIRSVIKSKVGIMGFQCQRHCFGTNVFL